MNEYYITRQEDFEQLEDIIQQDEHIHNIHRHKHIPYIAFESELNYEELTKRYPEPEYQISQPGKPRIPEGEMNDDR